MTETLLILLQDHTFGVILIGSLALGISSGILGSFAVLREQSLLGDAIAHATLPGVAAAFLFTHSKSPMVLLLGAGIAGWLGTLFIKVITENTRIKRDAALGITLSVFFGVGIMLLTIIQKLPTANKTGLDSFLFGNAATLLTQDIHTMLVLSGIIFLIVFLFWKEFKLVVFDEAYARSLGLKVHFLDILLTTLIVVAIVIGLQMVGVVLMSAMLVAPAAAARQWTDRLGAMVTISAAFGALAGLSGTLTSSLIDHMPTGPTIVLYLSAFVFLSLFFAPQRGLVWDWMRAHRSREKMQTTAMLKNLMLFSEISTNPFHPHDIAALKAIGRGTIRRTMQEMARKGWARETKDHKWALTKKGLTDARRLTQEYEDQFDVTTG